MSRYWKSLFAVSSTHSLEEALQHCISSFKTQFNSNTLSQQIPFCQLYIGRDFYDHQLALDFVTKQLQPKVLLGCAVDTIGGTSNGQKVIGTRGIAMNVCTDPTLEAVPFSYLPKKQFAIQVGRSFSQDRLERTPQKMEKFKSLSTSVNVELPSTLQELEKTEEPPTFLLMGDMNSGEFLSTLDEHFPQSQKVGIIGSSTPFINGHPHTLFLNDVCYSHGTLGVALSSKKTQFSSYLSSTGTLLGEKIKVLNSKGNLIHDVNDKLNPTQKLINAIKQRQLNPQKDEQFYLAVYDSDSDSNSNASKFDYGVFRITSGDPKKGVMSVDTTHDFFRNQSIQFMDARIRENTELNDLLQDENESFGLTFSMANEDTPTKNPRFKDLFIESENGIILSTPKSKVTSVHKLPGSSILFNLKEK